MKAILVGRSCCSALISGWIPPTAGLHFGAGCGVRGAKFVSR